ncbi:MAG: hypothetical protein WBX15_12555 [Thermoanaerobaculia bacterium]
MSRKTFSLSLIALAILPLLGCGAPAEPGRAATATTRAREVLPGGITRAADGIFYITLRHGRGAPIEDDPSALRVAFTTTITFQSQKKETTSHSAVWKNVPEEWRHAMDDMTPGEVRRVWFTDDPLRPSEYVDFHLIEVR